MTGGEPLVAPAGQHQAYFFRDQVLGWSNQAVSLELRLRGRIEREVLLAAVDELFARHEALRTTHRFEDGALVQCVRPVCAPVLHELRVRSAEPGDAALHDEIAAVLDAPFEMTRPLARVVLAHAGADDCVLLLVLHHAIADAVSCEVLEHELRALLAAGHGGREPTLPPVEVQLRDYAAWENAVDAEPHAAYWRPRLARTDLAVPEADEPVGVILRNVQLPPLSAAATAQLLEHAAGARTSLAFALSAGVAAALQPWAAAELRLGIVHANRFEPRFRSVVGPVANVLPLRMAVEPQLTFLELLANAKREWYGALAHRLPNWKLLELAGADDWHHRGFADVLVNYFERKDSVTTTVESPRHGRLTIAPYANPTRARVRCLRWDGSAFPGGFMFMLNDAGCVATFAIADPVLLSEAALAALGAHLNAVLTRFARAPQSAIGDAVERPPALFEQA